MDEQTLENLQTLGVELQPKEPVKVPLPTPEEVKKVVDDANKQIPPPADTIGNDEGADPKIPETDTEVQQPEPVKEELPPEEPKEEPKEDTEVTEDNLDDILNTLEDLSKESLDDIAKATNATTKKIKKVTVPDDGLSKEQSKTIQEIVDLNVKLQNELSVARITEKAKDQKIQELTEKINAVELDDTKEEVSADVKGINKYLKQFKSTNNETFKVKATQEALDFIENLWGAPLRGDYLGDRIEEQLKAIERITQKSDRIEQDEHSEPEDPNMEYIRQHGVGL